MGQSGRQALRFRRSAHQIKKPRSLAFAIVILTAFGPRAASAQITIKIPDIQRISKQKSESPRSGGDDDAQYDKEEFRSIKWGNTQYLAPYLECYATKHNLELIRVRRRLQRSPLQQCERNEASATS